MTRRHVSPAEIGDLFAAVRRSVRRWECQGHYMADEVELKAWRDGRPLDESEEDRVWEAYVLGLRAAGIPFERVRMVHEPPTLYQRWIHTTTDRNIRIGEDVRWLSESRARQLHMPADDFYLLDDERIAIMRFDGSGEMTGIDIDHDLDVVSVHRAWLARAWAVAMPHRHYEGPGCP